MYMALLKGSESKEGGGLNLRDISGGKPTRLVINWMCDLQARELYKVDK